MSDRKNRLGIRWFAFPTVCLATVSFVVNQLHAQGGGPELPDQMIVEKFDKDENGRLDKSERSEARKELATGGRRRRGPGRRRGGQASGSAGPKVSPSEVKEYPDAEFYDDTVLRTLFLEFEDDDWESELEAFKPTDVEIPAKMYVDGKEYPNVGISFRGASSFFSIPAGLKRSLNLSIDFVDKEQRLYGYKSLNLLNCNGDPSMMSSILYSYLSGHKIATPKVNYVKVVINGESWGLYVSSQQFNKTFLKEHYESGKGARWKVPGSPRGDGGLRYLGDEIEPYRERFEIKSKDKESSWRDLIKLCRVLNETPAGRLEEELPPILDIDEVLWFLAVDVAASNSDGYWTRASDYNIFQDEKGKFHILPHDMNEAFQVSRGGGGPRGPGRGGPGGPPGREGRGRRRRGGPEDQGRGGPDGPPPRGFGFPFGPPGGGPGGRGGPGGGGHGGIELDPLVGLDQERMPLRSVLLNNPKWKKQYLENLREIAALMDWKNIGPRVDKYRSLLEKEVALDTRKLFTMDDFKSATAAAKPADDSTSLRAFFDRRAAFLLKHESLSKAK